MSSLLWFTGNSGAGKSTIAFGVKDALQEQGITNVVVLDGDRMRATISVNDDLSREGRWNHNLRVARLAKELQAQELHVLVSVIAPFEQLRQEITTICQPSWVYIQRENLASEQRPYEPPRSPDLLLNHSQESAATSIKMVLNTYFAG